MTDKIIPSERVRELNAGPRRIPIDIEGSVTYEIPLTIWSVFNPKETGTTGELGEGWAEKVKEATPPDLTAELEELGGPWAHAWLAISGLLLSAPHPHDPGRVYAWLRTLGEQRLRRWLLGYSTANDDQALIEQASEGDVAAATQLLAENDREKTEMVAFVEWAVVTDGLPARYATALERFRGEVFAEYEEEFAGAIGRAAAARRAIPVRGSAKDVVEEVTSGIDFDIPLGTSRVVLVPSVLTRPLSLIDGHRGTLMVYYGIADEFVDGDPEAPPSWLVRTYKALGDERRLRIMRRLGESPASLDDLADLLGLSKSTVHHHLSLLRGAGLVRVHVPADKTSHTKSYSVRAQSLSDANGFLETYLRSGDDEIGERHA
jgi:DNA-binding transcriptional ArsR family regulator